MKCLVSLLMVIKECLCSLCNCVMAWDCWCVWLRSSSVRCMLWILSHQLYQHGTSLGQCNLSSWLWWAGGFFVIQLVMYYITCRLLYVLLLQLAASWNFAVEPHGCDLVIVLTLAESSVHVLTGISQGKFVSLLFVCLPDFGWNHIDNSLTGTRTKNDAVFICYFSNVTIHACISARVSSFLAYFSREETFKSYSTYIGSKKLVVLTGPWPYLPSITRLPWISWPVNVCFMVHEQIMKCTSSTSQLP